METTKEAVALELMKLISSKEVAKTAEKTKDAKSYYLALFKECLVVVNGK